MKVKFGANTLIWVLSFSNEDFNLIDKLSGMGFDVIEKVGPGGHYLQERHTVSHLRKELWMPALMTREHRAVWEMAGAKDMGQRLAERAQQLATDHQVPPLSDEVLDALQKLKCEGEAELTKK